MIKAEKQAELVPKHPARKMRWRDSWIVRAALVVILILLAGYITSAIITVQSIDSISRMSHDPDVERSLGKHLDALKKSHDLQQQLMVERLKPLVLPWASSAPAPLTANKVQNWLKLGNLGDMVDLSKVKVKKNNKKDESNDEALQWLGRHELRIIDYIVEFPKGQVFEAFDETLVMRQRYQLVGAQLKTNIRPTLIRTNSIILLVSFVLIIALFLYLTTRLTKRIEMVVNGFAVWSEVDANFRFGDTWRGELKVITEQFNEMAEEVEENRQRSLYLEKVASWQVIARKLAHEIKNPLTPIQMMVSQLKRRYKGEDPDFSKLLEEAQGIISEEVAGLRRMVDNFSNFARLPMPEPRTTNLLSLAQRIVELQKAGFEGHDISFVTSLREATGYVDEDLIRQVLINLIKNAAEASGEVPSTIKLILEEKDDFYFYKVNDNGPGIPQDLLSRVFEAYFTTKHTGPTPGMGLGLAVCQKIVLDHGGQMTVESHPGNTTFTIKLPKLEHKEPTHAGKTD